MKRFKKILGAIVASALILSLTGLTVFAAGGKNAPKAEKGRGQGYSVSENGGNGQRPRREDCPNFEDCPLGENCPRNEECPYFENCPRLNQDGTATPIADRQQLRDGTGCGGARNPQCPFAT